MLHLLGLFIIMVLLTIFAIVGFAILVIIYEHLRDTKMTFGSLVSDICAGVIVAILTGLDIHYLITYLVKFWESIL
jgi:hypothetical protein